MSEDLIGASSWAEFIFGTLVIFGWAAYMTGQALARTWRPWWHCLPYGILLGAGSRLFDFMLFVGPLLSLRGLLINAAYLVAVMLVTHRRWLSRMMVVQYPWLYEPAGLFGWCEKGGGRTPA